MCIQPNGAGKPGLLCCDLYIGQQAISELLDKNKVAYGAIGSTPLVCICLLYVGFAYCQQAKLHPFLPTLCAKVLQVLIRPKASLFAWLMVF